jgi:hypothetical protein
MHLVPPMASDWSQQHVRRLLWRAGFGASPEEAARWASAGKDATLRWVMDGGRGPELKGPPPRVGGNPLDPVNEWGHDVLWWLDRMVRTQRPLVEKLTPLLAACLALGLVARCSARGPTTSSWACRRA